MPKTLLISLSTLLLGALLLPLSANAAIDIYEFDTDSQRERYHVLVDELRCPKCQNQNLAGSNSQIAEDLRKELHRLLIAGQTDREIKDHMVARYGDFVLYKPPLQGSTLALWFLPVALLLVGVIAIASVIRLRRKAGDTQASLSNEERSSLDKLLEKESSD